MQDSYSDLFDLSSSVENATNLYGQASQDQCFFENESNFANDGSSIFIDYNPQMQNFHKLFEYIDLESFVNENLEINEHVLEQYQQTQFGFLQSKMKQDPFFQMNQQAVYTAQNSHPPKKKKLHLEKKLRMHAMQTKTKQSIPLNPPTERQKMCEIPGGIISLR